MLSKKKYFTLITCEHKSFGQLRQLDDFTINKIANLFVHGRLLIPKAHTKSSQTSKMEL